MESKYIFISAMNDKKSCQSHTPSSNFEAEYLLGNTNWTMTVDKDDPQIVSFECGQCGEVRTYRRLTQKTLL